MTIKVIQTRYKGYLFRSRLEARWAVFFDALGLKWEYEKEGYDLGAAGWYLPDFWLPEQQMWVEIKPIEFRRKALEQTKALSLATGCVVAILGEEIGPFKHTMVYEWDDDLQMEVPGDCVFFGSQYGWFPFGCEQGYTCSLKPGEADLMDGCCQFGQCPICGIIGFDHFGHHCLCDCVCAGTFKPLQHRKNGFVRYFCDKCERSSESPAPKNEGHLRQCKGESSPLLKAYAAARSARFEHGHSGATL